MSLKKSRLLASLDAAVSASEPNSSTVNDTSCSDGDGNHESFDMDAEFAAFQVSVPASMSSISVQHVLCFEF